MGHQRRIDLNVDAALGKFFFQNGFHHFFAGSGRDGGLHQHQTVRLDVLAQSADAFPEMGDVAIAFFGFAKSRLGGIELDIHHHHVHQAIDKVFACGAEVLLFHHGAVKDLGHFGIGRCHRWNATVDDRHFPIGTFGGTLMPVHIVIGLAVFIGGVCHHGGHHAAHKAQTLHGHDLAAQFALFFRNLDQ